MSHYGIAIAHEHPDLVRFVNAVLESMRADGTWDELHETARGPTARHPDAEPPHAGYRD